MPTNIEDWAKKADDQNQQNDLASMPAKMHKANTLTFGQALEALKHGSLVCRTGWNGKGMFIFMRPEDQLDVNFIINTVKSLPASLKKYYEVQESKLNQESIGRVKFTAYLCMKATDGTIVNGWLASQTDMLAEDWEVFEI